MVFVVEDCGTSSGGGAPVFETLFGQPVFVCGAGLVTNTLRSAESAAAADESGQRGAAPLEVEVDAEGQGGGAAFPRGAELEAALVVGAGAGGAKGLEYFVDAPVLPILGWTVERKLPPADCGCCVAAPVHV